MFRCAVVFVLCIFFALGAVGQPPQESTPETPPPKRDLYSPKSSRIAKGELQISIARLQEPPSAQRLYNKALIAWIKRHRAEAQRRVEQALNIYSAFPEALTLHGVIWASFQQWDLAAQELEAAIRADPGYSPAYVVLAGVYNSEKRFDEAERAAKQAASNGADGWHLQYEMVRALIGQHKYESALRTANLALIATPDEGLLHLAKAHSLLGLGRYPEAVVELKTYLRYEPEGDGSQDARNLLQQIRSDAGTGE